MLVRRLALEDFRSYAHAEIELASSTTVFVGPNGAGKTNILEALHLLARGDSARARDEAELIRWGAAVARAGAEVVRDGEQRRLEIALFSPSEGERRRPRRYLVDGSPKRADEALGQLVVVAFFPEDVELMSQAPSARRRYLDAMISQVDRRHRADGREHQRVLEQRNALLRALRDEQALRAKADLQATLFTTTTQEQEELVFWDAELCRLAASISARRMVTVRELRGPFRDLVERWSGERDIDVAYATPAEGETEAERAGSYRRLLEEKREKELWQGMTLVGPHREDLAVTAAGRLLPSYASRGEQRTVVLALKLAEAAWLRERTGTMPVFLLDDVLSELDPERRERLAEALPDDAQALITSALPVGIPASLTARAAFVPVSSGRIG